MGLRVHRAVVMGVLAVAVGLVSVLVVLFMFVRQPGLRTAAVLSDARSSPDELRRHVAALVNHPVPRNTRHPQRLDEVARYIGAALAEAGGRVREQPYPVDDVQCRNVIARFGPEEGRPLVVGAHYDVCDDLPGADDNASGVAGLLELGRLLGESRPTAPVDLVAFSTEEPPYFGTSLMGSAVHARSLREDGTTIRGMICLEMIGYFTDRQPSPHWLIGLLYPRTGDFITVVGRWEDRQLVRTVTRGMDAASPVRACAFTGPPILGADLSDHRNYWYAGFNAVMITDTAYIRNPNYHTARDTPDTLDYGRMAGVVDGLLNAVLHLGRDRIH